MRPELGIAVPEAEVTYCSESGSRRTSNEPPSETTCRRAMLAPTDSRSASVTVAPEGSRKEFPDFSSFQPSRSASHPASNRPVVRKPGAWVISKDLMRPISGRAVGASKSPASACLTGRPRAQFRSQRTVRASGNPAISETMANCPEESFQCLLSKRSRSTQRQSLPSTGARKSACHQRARGRSESRCEKTTLWREWAASPPNRNEICSLQTAPPLAPRG